MNQYRLDKLVFKNFKLFDEKLFTIKFDNNDLVVFDGPNGYGKTTVYDALELALTGNIRRLIPVENRQVPGDVVVAHKKRPNCEVQLTLINVNNNSTITIIRRLKLSLPPQSKKIANFIMLWDLFQLENGSENRIEQGVLDSLIGTENLSRDYTLFHYVEQEDTAHFLKSKTEVERAKALAKIFGDTTEVQRHHKKIEDVGKKIAKEIQSVDVEIDRIDKQYQFSENKKFNDSNKNIDYKVLLHWRDIPLEWDLENIQGFTPEKRNRIIFEVNNIKELLKHRDEFVSSRVYIKACGETDVLKHFLMNYNFVGQFESLSEKHSKCKTLNNALHFLSLEKLSSLEVNVDLLKTFEIITYPEGDKFIANLHLVLELQQRNVSSNSLYSELIKYRKTLNEKHNCTSFDKDCPFCGTVFLSSEALKNSIEAKGKFFRSLLTEDGKKLVDLQEKFLIEHLKPLGACPRTEN